jgi:hypothetical protein
MCIVKVFFFKEGSVMEEVDRKKLLENARAELAIVRHTNDSGVRRTFVDGVNAGIRDGWLSSLDEIGITEVEFHFLEAVATLD